MNQPKLETKTEMKVGEMITIEDRKLIPIEKLLYSANTEPANLYWFGVVEPQAILVVDSTGEYLVSLSKEITSFQEAIAKTPGLTEAIEVART